MGLSHQNLITRSSVPWMRWLLVLGFATVLIGWLVGQSVSVAQAATIVVNTLDDENNTDGDCSLREAITAINTDTATDGCPAGSGADIITFSVSGTIVLGSTLPAINSTVTLDGTGQTIAIDGAASYRVLYVTNTANLTINSIIVQNGSVAGDGGGIYNNGGTVTVRDSTISGNRATTQYGSGGGIYNNNGTVSVINSVFSGNDVTYRGGGVAQYHGTTRISNSTFSSNHANLQGGGIFSFSELSITNSTFTNNVGRQDGGGITSGSGMLTISNSTFSGNRANLGSGGGIRNTGTLTLTNSTFSDNFAYEDGGGIDSIGALTLTSSTFSGNIAFNGSGGGIYNEFSEHFGGTMHLAGNIFQHGTSGNNCAGSGILNDNGYNLSSDASCSFSGLGSANDVSYLSLGTLSGTGPGQQVHTPQTGSVAISAIPSGTSITNNTVTWTCNQSGSTDQLSANRPINAGDPCTAGAVEVEVSASTLCPAPLAISSATELAGCIIWSNVDPDATALALDADITLSGALPSITTQVILDGREHFVSGNHSVRVLYSTATANLTLDSITILNGFANYGGGILNDGTLTIRNSTISGNTADYGGGIINNGTLTMTTITVSGNTATDQGGGIYNSWGDLTLTQTTISGNTANAGGGMTNYYGNSTVMTSTFSNNVANLYSGGGIDNRGNLTVSASTFSTNVANQGGGIYNTGTLRLAGNVFQRGTNGANCSGTVNDNGYNLSSDVSCTSGGIGSQFNVSNLNLGALSGNGPGQHVHTPQTGSAALSAIPNGTSITNNNTILACNDSATDQLGSLRPISPGDACTAGAVEVVTLYDFGDAPDPTFPTLRSSDGARHVLGSSLHLGSTVDSDLDGQPTADARGDNLTGLDDEDGVTFTLPLVAGTMTELEVVASATGYLSAWLDFNRDGDWTDAGEQIATDQIVTADTNIISFVVPVGATPGTTFARFRLSSSTGLSYTGTASDGEVEDYQVTLHPPSSITISGYPPNLTVGEDGTTDIYTLTLDRVPSSPVIITSTPGTDCQINSNGLGVAVVTTLSDTTPLTLTVSTIDNTTVDGSRTCTITHSVASADPSYNGLSVGDVVTDVIDDDVAGVSISEASITTSEVGTSATFGVVLTSQPSADVNVTFSGVDASEGSLDVASLNFTNADWDVAQSVTVTGLDDAMADGDISYTVTATASSTDSVYNGLTATIDITNTDDDTEGIAVAPLSVTTNESGTTATFSVVLASQPSADVSIAFTSGNITEGLLSTGGGPQQPSVTLTFSPSAWNTAQTVTVHGQDDLGVDGDVAYTITSAPTMSTDPGYNGLDASDVSVTNQDNDSPVIADDDAYATDEDQPLVVTAADGVLNGDSGGNGSALRAVLDSNPTNGTLNSFNADGSFEYTPNPGYVGADSFTYHASDGTNDSASATVTITVALVNGTIVARDDGTDMPMNTSITLDVLANDSDPEGEPLHIARVTQPAHGQAVVENERIVYTPHAGYTGQDTFTYTAADPFGASDTATVSIVVWQPVPLCANFDGSTTDIVRASVPAGTVTQGSVFCRILVEHSVFVRLSAEIGKPEVLERGVIQAVDAFALCHDGSPTAFFNNPVTICLQGVGAFLYLDATVAPRAMVELPVFLQSGYTCAAIPNAGTVVLVNDTASAVHPVPEMTGPTTTLGSCMVTTRDMLNLRAEPSATSTVQQLIPYDVTLTAIERTSGWFHVDYLGQRGWVSAGYVTPQEGCEQ